MTRRQRQGSSGRDNITYDLSQPRNVAAFEALLLDEDEDEGATQGPNRPGRKQQQQQQQQPGVKKKREKEKFFMLRTDAGTAAAAAAAARSATPGGQEQEQQLRSLLDMFQGSSLDAGLVRDVLQSTGSLEAAAEALLAMLASSGPPSTSHMPHGADGASSSRAQASPSLAAVTAGSASGTAGGASWWQQQQQEMPLLTWSDLPSDVRSTILSHLTPRDLAQAASTNNEFRAKANAMRAHVRHLVLLPGLSYGCLKGMVGAHISAGVVDFSRYERHLAKQDPDELLPQVVAMHKQEAEASLFRGIVAAAEGAGSSTRTVPVSSLCLRGLVGTTDKTLAEALQSFRDLRGLDVSHCPNLTNKSLYLLAKYKAAKGPGSTDDSALQQPQQPRAAAAAAAAGGVQDADSNSEDFAYLLPEEGRAASSGSSDMDEEEAAALEAALAASAAEAAAAAAGAGAAAAAAAAGAGAGAGVAGEAAAAAPPAGDAEAWPLDAPMAPDAAAARGPALSSELLALQIHTSLFHHPEEAPGAPPGFAPVVDAPPAAVAAAAADVGLRDLKLSGNRAFQDDGLRHVLQGPLTRHSLTRLDISGCRSITSSGLILPPWGVLRELRASRCSGLTQLFLHMPPTHPLGLLDLSACHFLRLLDLALPGLTELHLSACGTLYRLRLRCPLLTSLSLSHCANLVDFHEDAWQVPALQHLNMYGCRRASGSQLQAVLHTLPDLRWLSVNGCHGIQSLHLIRNLQLESVDLSGCRYLAAFSSSSACLQHLTAASCGRLLSLSLASKQLSTLLLPNCTQLADVHVVPPTAAAGAGGVPAAEAAAATAAAAGSGSTSGGGSGGGRRRPRLDTKGCSRLSPAARAVLASAMARPTETA